MSFASTSTTSTTCGHRHRRRRRACSACRGTGRNDRRRRARQRAVDRLDGPAPSRDAPPRHPAADDLALVLHTSGTTSRPKIVPLTQRNLAASARNIARRSSSRPGDRCLNVMPLFHIHGLVAALLASLSRRRQRGVHARLRRRSVPPLDRRRCGRPGTRAVPTMHQAVLARRSRGRRAPTAAALRPLVVGVAAAAAVIERFEDRVRRPRRRGLRHDRGCAPDGQQPAAAAARASPARSASPPAPRSRSSTPRTTCSPPASVGEVVDPRRQRRSPATRTTPRPTRRRSPTAGSAPATRAARRRRLPVPHRTAEGADQPRRREDLAARGRRGAARHPAVRRGRHVRRSRTDARRGRRRRGRAAGGRAPRGRELRGSLGAQLAPFKVPAPHRVRRRDAQGATGKVQRIGLADKLASLSAASTYSPKELASTPMPSMCISIETSGRIGIAPIDVPQRDDVARRQVSCRARSG